MVHGADDGLAAFVDVHMLYNYALTPSATYEVLVQTLTFLVAQNNVAGSV
jgi:hypothetical protein